MQLITNRQDLRSRMSDARRAGVTIGFVPTMGALHQGHAQLIRTARAANGCVVVSIFVNPTQFGPNEDFDRYPRRLEADCRLAEAAGADIVYAPTVEEMYPAGFRTQVEVKDLSNGLCGRSRPTHFVGVTTVVTKLFLQVLPDRAYFGMKDAQQLRIIEQMTRDLDLPIEIVPCPTVREADGLAMSSRNQYLTPEHRAQVPALYRALFDVERAFHNGIRRTAELLPLLRRPIEALSEARLDYAEIVAWEDLQPLDVIDRPALAALAVYFGSTRLIDNIRL